MPLYPRPLPGLRAARRAAHLTQQELADKAGFSVSAVARIEQGGNEAKASTAERLARVLGVPVEQLTAGVGLTPTPRRRRPRRRLTTLEAPTMTPKPTMPGPRPGPDDVPSIATAASLRVAALSQGSRADGTIREEADAARDLARRIIASADRIKALLNEAEEMPDEGGDHRLVPDPKDVEP